MTDRFRSIALALSIALWLTGPAIAADQFMFGGLGLSSTLEDARRLYPRSLITEGHITVSDGDLRDHIGSIDLPGTGTDRRLRFLFERTTRRTPSYPSCDRVLVVLRNSYGPPSLVQEFDEEQARNRRYIWSRGGEELSLLCFRLRTAAFSASELTITLR